MASSTNRSEEEYFARREAELRQARAQEAQRGAERTERERLQELHFMRCPKCGMLLETIDYRGVLVDRCTSCRGTWLDDGELELLASPRPGPLQRMVSAFRR